MSVIKRSPRLTEQILQSQLWSTAYWNNLGINGLIFFVYNDSFRIDRLTFVELFRFFPGIIKYADHD